MGGERRKTGDRWFVLWSSFPMALFFSIQPRLGTVQYSSSSPLPGFLGLRSSNAVQAFVVFFIGSPTAAFDPTVTPSSLTLTLALPFLTVPSVGGSVQETLEKGTSFGAPSLHENTLAKKVIEAVPSVEMVRFTNSGTEVGRRSSHKTRLVLPMLFL